jgi:integrase
MGLEFVTDITFKLLVAWINKLKLSGRRPATIAAYLGHIAGFCRWAVSMGFLPADPTENIIRPHAGQPPVVYYTPAQIAEILITARAIDERFYRVLLIIRYTGLRQDECLRLRREAFDLEKRTITLCGKGGKWRTIPICAPLLAKLPEILPAAGFLFTGRTRRGLSHITQGLIYQWWSRLKKQLPHIICQRAVGVGAALHGLRSSFATEAAKRLDTVEGLRLLQTWMGHSDMRTLHRYLAASRGYDPAIEKIFT